jgi:hypothetical protein
MEYPNWFNYAAKNNFEIHLAEFAGKPNLRFLQLGAFTGDASVWMLDNVLTDPTSSLVDVDTWAGSPTEGVHSEIDFEDVWQTYLHKVKDYDNVYPIRTTTNNFFNGYGDDGDWWFDFIYVDADHTSSGVLDDAVMGWQHLKRGGIMAFDDYTWTHDKGELYEPKRAINFFYWVKQLEIEIITSNAQVWIRKI